MSTDWFTTTPEATLRAESMLTAFRENRIEDIGAMLAVDYDDEEVANPLHLLIAMMSIADRLADYAVTMHQEHGGLDIDPGTVTHQAVRVVAEAAINIQEDEDDE